MSRIGEALLGSVALCVLSADTPGLLGALRRGGLRVRDFREQDRFQVTFRIPAYQLKKCRRILIRRGERFRVTARAGLAAGFLRHRDRLPLALAVVGLTAFFLWLPTRVLFLEAEGNNRVPAGEILSAARESGVTFFTEGASIRSEELKNHLLEKIPSLSWAGINMNGSTAVITVREREDLESPLRDGAYSDVVASRDGIVVSVSVLEGESRCQPGKAVRQGELLVSGCVEHEFQPQYTHSEAEIYALTQHSADAVLPAERLEKGYTGKTLYRWSLIVGRKRINLSGNSGILTTTCDKMYEEYYVTLPGGWKLPLALVREVCRPYILSPVPIAQSEAGEVLTDFSRRQTEGEMLAGEILCAQQETLREKDRYILRISFTCREMIARQRQLHLFEGENTNDGTNH